jgi:hypothetical protein
MSEYSIAPYSEDAMPQAVSPEGAEIANTYLANACSINDTSRELGIPTYEISAVLHEPLVKTYVNAVLRESGYQSMLTVAEKLDELIEMKWAELQEAEIGSNKDISDLLALAHKVRLDMSKLLQADTLKAGPGTVKQTQVNVFGEGSYAKLMEKLIDG